MSTSNVKTSNNSVVEPFDWDKYDNNQQDKAEAKVSNLEDEINFYKKRIELKKKDINKLESNLKLAESKLKKAKQQIKELAKASEIVELLKANAGKRVVISFGVNYEGIEPLIIAKAEEVKLEQRPNGCWVLSVPNKFASAIDIVEEIYVLGYGKE